VSGGVLTLNQDNSGGIQYDGGIVSKFPLSYGFYEARVQYVSGFPAWWIVSHELGSDPIPQNPAVSGTEMDLAEGRAWNGTPSQISHSVHWNGYGSGHQSQEVHPGTADDAGWHTIGFWWTTSSHRFYVDGVLTWTFTTAVSQSPREYMVLNNAHHANSGPVGVARWDYVRYWTDGP
jgi:beta-glucanase (GH16 family)